MSLLRSIFRYALLQKRGAHVVSNKFVPKSEPVNDLDINDLRDFLLSNNKILVLTGAGLSTESGIPDYRSEGVGLYARSDNRPVQYNDFMKSETIRQRYWARNYVGWPVFSSFLPNISHKILRHWEIKGKVHWLVTQNVDALHMKAGSINLTELHGSAHRVMCMNCDAKMPRTRLQELIEKHNPLWLARSVEMAPDGDVQLTTEQVKGFKVPQCPSCGGALKPEIIFFGDNVPKPTVNLVFDKVKESDAVLVLGSSLEVYSGYRFVNAAHTQKKPIAIVNIGATRADNLASLKITARCSDVLRRLEHL
ncbi:NAD-dependent protein lipoamidase sirtuin-4, mitochondrial-like [Pecten maximus]|uniref:NAD-dependent protein lipoamidase sirtuin-4, mitochondrial-like n=1 Tax=Pecten maximus TaxID=6579 RepID=UPI001458460B|nr:NAD-dependent protein lipoamidase sirtuin-4, mitochondrial-like [Pecten maximus]